MKHTPILIAFVITGCMVGEDSLPTESDIPRVHSEASLTNNARTAFNYFVNKGLTDVQAAGVVGNLMQESDVLPTAVQQGGLGRGIAQWSVGGRFDHGAGSLSSYATAHGGSRWALTTQLDFIWYELTTTGGFGLADLQAATTITAAVTAFQDKYEVCGRCVQTLRLQYAEQALADYGTPGDDGSSTPPPPPPTSSCYSGTLERDLPENSCVESKYDGLWYQCASGEWVDRWSDPDACVAEYPL